MTYSIEPKNRIYAKGYGFLSFAKNMSTHTTKVVKNVSNKYSQTDEIKTASVRAIQKAARSNW